MGKKIIFMCSQQVSPMGKKWQKKSRTESLTFTWWAKCMEVPASPMRRERRI